MSTLKSLTKVELIALVVERNTEIAGLRMKLSVAQRNDAPAAKPAYVRTPHALPTHFAAARDAAMRMGRSVKVEA